MKKRSAYLALGMGLLAAAPAAADGWQRIGGSVKEGGPVAVPVPVPVPIPDSIARWYLRADLSLGYSDVDISENGLLYGRDLYWPQDLSTPFRTPGSWAASGDTDATFSVGGGFGYYWSPRFRTDLTLEGRTQRELKIKGTYQYDQESYDGAVWSPTGLQVDGETSDTTKLDSGVVLLNAYYDFFHAGPLTPYIGGGIGFAVNALERSFANREYACDPAPLPPGQDCLDTGWPSPLRARETSYDVSFAAAFSAGFSYTLSPVTMVDVGYRYLYIGGSDADLSINGVRSRVSVGDINEHQLRAGLRWNIQ
ncbi:MAG: outer membrane beta-barrel protein [Hyphomicrobiaceae bacterium]|nr:outer membrane beta-barrel protein [Hyphomicrobiaceae bacterium]